MLIFSDQELPENLTQAHAEIIVLRRMVDNMTWDIDQLAATVYNCQQLFATRSSIPEIVMGEYCYDTLVETCQIQYIGNDDDDAAVA